MNEKRIIYIDGLKTGFKGANTLLELVEKEKTNIKKHGKTLDHHKTHLEYLTKSIMKLLSGILNPIVFLSKLTKGDKLLGFSFNIIVYGPGKYWDNIVLSLFDNMHLLVCSFGVFDLVVLK